MIADYAELVTETAHRTGVTDVASRAGLYAGMAEAWLSRQLRVSGMETAATLTTSSTGEVGLPADYQQMRTVEIAKQPLARLPLAQVRSGKACGYVIQGATLLSSEVSTAHDIVYYASLPSLSANGTNWLLSANPDLYLHAMMFQVFTAKLDTEKAQAAGSYALSLIEDENRADKVGRFAGMRISAPGSAA